MTNSRSASSTSRRRLLIIGAILVAIVGGASALLLPFTHPAERAVAGPHAVVAFYGDSYTFGVQASSPDARWSSLLSAEQGWTEVNAGVSGLGFVANREGTDAVGQVIAAEPELIIVAMGLNDTYDATSRIDEIDAAIRADLARFQSEAPQARINAFFDGLFPTGTTSVHGTPARAAAKAIDGP